MASAYWDGGYMGNPALYPLFYATKSKDLLLVQINPLQRPEVPTTPQDILERINEISFNASLLHELRAIAFVQRLLDEQRVDPGHYKRINLHMIEAEERLRTQGAATKSDTSPAFIERLFEIGRTAALDWIGPARFITSGMLPACASPTASCSVHARLQSVLSSNPCFRFHGRFHLRAPVAGHQLRRVARPGDRVRDRRLSAGAGAS